MPETLRARTIHVDDPRDVIREKCGFDLNEIELWGSSVLVGIYIRPVTAFANAPSIMVVDKTVDEDRYQGKVGLVLALGPRAFVDNERDYPQRLFNGLTAKPGDWVVFRASDGLKMMVGDCECRCIPDINIKAKITHPDAVF
jgi:hypothetical protein